jgi:ABC-type sugar transport system substrate-binding protein
MFIDWTAQRVAFRADEAKNSPVEVEFLRSKWKILNILLMFPVAALILSACGSSSGVKPTTSGQKTYTIGVALANLPDPFQVSQYYGMVEEAKKEGNVKLILADAGGYNNVAKQVSQLQNFITQHVDAVILIACSPSGTQSAVEQLKAHNIPVINVGSKTNGPTVTYVGSDNKQIGEDEAIQMVDLLHGKGSVIMLSGPAGASWAVIRSQAFQAYIKAHSSINIVKEQWEDSSPMAGLNTMSNLLNVFPNVNGVYTGSDFLGDGAADAIKAAGKTGQMVITTAVLEPETVSYIKNNRIQMTAAQRGVLIGSKSVQATMDALNGKTVPALISVPDLIVTPSNIGTVDMSQIQAPADFKP